jgi:hypothetical protein
MNLKKFVSPTTSVPKDFDPGAIIFSWEASDYHPHKRGWSWFLVFSLVVFGGSGWAIYADPKWGWTTAVVILLTAALYFWIHRKGEEIHEIRVCEHGVFIDRQFVSRDQIAGFWMVYDETVSVLNLELKGNKNQKISLQMGDRTPDFFQENFERMDLPELTDKKESLVDLWIRALKL